MFLYRILTEYKPFEIIKVFDKHVLCVDDYGNRESFCIGELIMNGIISNEDLNRGVVYEKKGQSMLARLAMYF